MDVKAVNVKQSHRGNRSVGKTIRKDLGLYVMLAFPIIIALIFRYAPIGGMVIAFKDYNLMDGIFGSSWSEPWYKWFEKFLGSQNFGILFGNTLKISFWSLLIGFPCPIIFALSLNEVMNGKFKKVIQTCSYLPYFVSTVIVIGMLNQLTSPTTGVVNEIVKAFGGTPINFAAEPKYFVGMYVISGIWSSLGYNSILYLSALSGISQELYEAAEVDGAGRWRKMWHVTLPGILPTILILLLMQVGSLLTVGYEKAYLMQNPLNLSASEIIGTYVYKQGIVRLNYSYSSAVDMFNGVLNLILVTAFNTISKKTADISLW